MAETGSTNRDLLEAAAAGVSEGLVLVADYQSAGRGRLDRAWSAPAGASLLVSARLRPSVSPDELFLLTLACGLAAIDAVDEVAGIRPGLKWPNDLIVAEGPLADRKLAGILAESHVANGRVEAVVVGMGLNLDWPADLPEELSLTAASVNHLTGSSVDREDVLVAWLRHFDRYLLAISDDGGRSSFLQDVRAASSTIGRDVRVESTNEFFDGRAVGIADDGRLLVDRDGTIVSVIVGDIVHARLLS
ncbi:MAG: biotin--[acetyl-CoA-carboxylase] ligase [Thermoleophilia bacterium]|nr:biotin--[acetyl-CoA-carboxylase] ligase [Thermoleophilia bacterium]